MICNEYACPLKTQVWITVVQIWQAALNITLHCIYGCTSWFCFALCIFYFKPFPVFLMRNAHSDPQSNKVAICIRGCIFISKTQNGKPDCFIPVKNTKNHLFALKTFHNMKQTQPDLYFINTRKKLQPARKVNILYTGFLILNDGEFLAYLYLESSKNVNKSSEEHHLWRRLSK